jgi:hypothetical protein
MMQVTYTAQVEALNTRHDSRGKTKILSKTRASLSMHDVFFNKYWSLFVMRFIAASLKSNLSTAITKQNTTENCSISHAQNTKAVGPNTFVAGIHVRGHNEVAVTPRQPLQVLSKVPEHAVCLL